MKALDPNDWNSIKEYVEFQVEIENELMQEYSNIDVVKISREDLSQFPPGFIPIELRIDPNQTPVKNEITDSLTCMFLKMSR